MFRKRTKDTAIVARGELTPRDRTRAVSFLQELGLSVSLVQPREHERLIAREGERLIGREEGVAETFRFGEIITPTQYMGREHISQFHAAWAPEFSKQTAGGVFHTLVHPRRQEYRGTYGFMGIDVSPEDVGLVVKERAEVGFSPFLKPYRGADKVVQVGGVVDFANRLLVGDIESVIDGTLHSFGNEKEAFLGKLATQLARQMSVK